MTEITMPLTIQLTDEQLEQLSGVAQRHSTTRAAVAEGWIGAILAALQGIKNAAHDNAIIMDGAQEPAQVKTHPTRSI